MPRYQSMINAQIQVETGDTSSQDRTVNDSQTKHDVIRYRVVTKIKEVELTGGPKIFKPQGPTVDPRPIRKNRQKKKKDGKQQDSKGYSHNSEYSHKMKTPKNKKLPIKKAIKSTWTCYQRNDALFQDHDFNKIYHFMKKLDTRKSESSTTHLEALQVPQRRQTWIQAWNVPMANLNKREVSNIFTLYQPHIPTIAEESSGIKGNPK